MSLKGDIDLTENLDFRRNRKKKSESNRLVPWKPNEVKSEDYFNPTYNINDRYRYAIYYMNSNRSTTYNFNSVVTYTNTTTSITDDMWYSDRSNYTSCSDAIDSYCYGISYNGDYINIKVSNNTKPITHNYPWKTKPKKTLINAEPFRYKFRATYSYDPSKKHNYPWSNKSIKEDIINALPWRKISSKNKIKDRLNMLTRSSNTYKCPWLNHLTDTQYDNYMDDLLERKDDSSLEKYLTNMGWLHLDNPDEA